MLSHKQTYNKLTKAYRETELLCTIKTTERVLKTSLIDNVQLLWTCWQLWLEHNTQCFLVLQMSGFVYIRSRHSNTCVIRALSENVTNTAVRWRHRCFGSREGYIARRTCCCIREGNVRLFRFEDCATPNHHHGPSTVTDMQTEPLTDSACYITVAANISGFTCYIFEAIWSKNIYLRISFIKLIAT